MNHNFIDVCTNREGTTMAASGLGSAGGGTIGIYGTPTGFADIDFGSGGAGAAGGGRGAGLGGTAIGTGGNGGGKITVISRLSSGAPYTFTLTGAVRANGGNGGAGGSGGNSGRTANNCCSDFCDQANTEEATNVTGGGGGGGGGAGSGGGVLLIAYGNSSLGGNIQAIGGNGGAGGSGGGASTSTYGAGGLCGSAQTINNFAGDVGGTGGAGGGGRIKIFVSECGSHTATYTHSVAAGTGSGTPGAGSHHYGFIPGTELIAGSISSAQTICEGQSPSSNLTTTLPTGGVGNFEYQWYRSNTCASATTGSSSAPASGWTAIVGATSTTLTPAQIGTLTSNTCFQLRYQSGTCFRWSNSIQITVNPAATANAGSAATICSGSTYTLTGSSVGGSATTGAWSIVSTTGSLTTNSSQLSSISQTSNPSAVTFTPVLGTFGTATLRLTTNDPDGAGPCSPATSQVVVTVNQNATANAGSPATICSGSAYALAGSSVGGSATTGAWSIISATGSLTTNSSQLSSTAQTANPSTVTFTPTLGTFGTATLRLTTNDPAGPCNAVTSDVVITVNQNATANAGSAATICTGTTHTLAGSSVGGSASTGAWSIISTTGTLTTNSSQLSSTAQTANPSTVTFTPTLGTSGTATLRLTTNDPAGPCNPATSDIVITVDQNPTTSNAGSNFSICNSTTATLAGNTPAVGVGTWTVVSGTANITSPNSPTSGLTGLVPGNPSSSVTLRWTIANGTCTSSFSDVTITNFAASNGSLAVSVPSTICEGQTANIGLLTGTIGSQFQWQSSPDGSTWSNISGATSSTYTTPPLNTTTTDNWFRASVANGTCPAAFSLPVLVNVDPEIANNTIASDQSVCLGSTPNTIIGSLPTGGNGSFAYAWQISTTSAAGPWSFIPSATGQNYSPGPTSQQTWFRRRVTSSLCQEFSNTVQIDILTGNSNVFLVSGDTRTALEECVDGDWTYYSTALNPDQFIFAIRKYTNNFTATVTIVDEPGTTTYSSIGGVGPARGTFLAGRTYDVNITSGSVTTPVDIRFFIDVNELAQALAEAQALLAVTPIPGSSITPLTFFKAPTTFNPTTMVNSGNFTFTPTNTWTYGPANPVAVAPPDGFINGVAYYELTGLTSFSGGTGGYSVNDGAPALLPVELISFTANAIENRYIRLDWRTATEINNELFEIERSLDGINFEKIGEVQGSGNSTQIINYTFNDMEPNAGINYYRLKQIDFDGTFEYSDIVNARISVRDNFEVSNFIPNPAEGSTTLRFSSMKKQTVQIQIFNIMGQIVESKSVELLPGVQTIHFDTQLYADGTYTAVIKANNDVHTRKLIISK